MLNMELQNKKFALLDFNFGLTFSWYVPFPPFGMEESSLTHVHWDYRMYLIFIMYFINAHV